ncbi:MAG: O-antigen ligase family protein [Candidatus Omnitrophota bacterium]|nr:O-antigen ligase family protein [Candidatus Omnitrophota bacterium]
MEKENPKLLSFPVFYLLLSVIFLRPFISGLAYPAFETYYESFIISIALAVLLLSAQRFRELKINTLIFPILLLLASYVISTVTSINIYNSIKETLKLLSYISVFFIVSQIDGRQKIILIKTMVVTASIISLYSIYQYFWGYQHTLNYIKKTNMDLLSISSYSRDILLSKRAIGTFPSPNILGGYLIMMFFLSLATVKNKISDKKWLISSFLIATAMVLTKSMGTWLSVILTLIVLIAVSYNRLEKQRWLIAISSILIFLILLFIILNRREYLMNLENPENSITQRLNYWRAAIGIIKDHSFLGVGPGNFQEVFLKYKTGLSTNTRYAHNIFLHIWSEAGVLGFTGISFLLFSLFLKGLKKDGQKFILLAIIAFLLHNLIDNTYFIPEAGLFWWILMGLAF